MLILVNARCTDCGESLTPATSTLVIEWQEDTDRPLIYVQCKNRAICAHNQTRKAT